MKNRFELQKRDLECTEHTMHLDWSMTNVHGNPALCCSQCITKSRPRRGLAKYIRYVKTVEIPVLQAMGIEERF